MAENDNVMPIVINNHYYINTDRLDVAGDVHSPQVQGDLQEHHHEHHQHDVAGDIHLHYGNQYPNTGGVQQPPQGPAGDQHPPQGPADAQGQPAALRNQRPGQIQSDEFHPQPTRGPNHRNSPSANIKRGTIEADTIVPDMIATDTMDAETIAKDKIYVTPNVHKLDSQTPAEANASPRAQRNFKHAATKSPAVIRRLFKLFKPFSNSVKRLRSKDKKAQLRAKFKCLEECMTQYAAAVCADRPEEAEQFLITARDNIARESADATGNRLTSFAHDLIEEEKLLESSMTFMLAADDFAKRRNAIGISDCGAGLQRCAKALIERPDSKRFAEGHVLPLLERLIVKIERVDKCAAATTSAATLLVCVSCVHFSLAEHERMRRTCERGVSLLETELGAERSKHFVYGQLLANLGLACARLSRPQDAADYSHRALEVFKLAKDFPTEDDRNKLIEQCKTQIDMVK